jgi:uncharacterized protein YegL
MSQETMARKPPTDAPAVALVPVMLLADVSYSMHSGPGTVTPIEVVNLGLKDLIETLKKHPEAADTAFVALAKFSDTADVILPFTRIGTATTPPQVEVEGNTCFGAAFSLVRRELTPMVVQQKQAGAVVYRPTVYMVTDGNPSDSGWEAELDALSTSSYAPNICVFGVAGASEATLRMIARRDRGQVWLADEGTDPVVAFANLFPALIRSVMDTANAAAAAGGGTIPAPIPGHVPGMTKLDPL